MVFRRGGPVCTIPAVVVTRDVFCLHAAAQTKVSDLADQPGPDQDVACSQVTVDEVVRREMGHARRYLAAETVLGIHDKRLAVRRVLLKKARQLAVLYS